MSRQLKIPPPTLPDRLVQWLSPERGRARMHARLQLSAMASYAASDTSRGAIKRWVTSRGTSADTDTLLSLPDLRAKSRDLVRNTPVAAGALGTTTTNVVGAGLQLQSRIDADLLGLTETESAAWEHRAEMLWRIFCAECDLSRTLSFGGMQNLTFRSALESGDVFVVRRFKRRAGDLFGTKLQLVEADRVAHPRGELQPVSQGEPEIVGGVEIDQDGAPVAYYVHDRHPFDFLSPREDKPRRVPAFGAKSGERLVLHLYHQLRPGQHRGVPIFAPITEPLKQYDRYMSAEIDAAVIGAFLGVVVTTEAGEGLKGITPQTEAQPEGDAPQVDLGPVMVLGLRPGESIEQIKPERPNPQIGPFTEATLRLVGAALGLPYEVLVLQFQASYSASRASLLQAWQQWRVRRSWLAEGFCDPVYRDWFLPEAIAAGLLEAPGFFASRILREAWSGREWIGPAPGQIDPWKEIQAAERAVDIGVSTLQEQTAAITGGDWETKHRQRAKEVRMRREDGVDGSGVADRTRTEQEIIDDEGTDVEDETAS